MNLQEFQWNTIVKAFFPHEEIHVLKLDYKPKPRLKVTLPPNPMYSATIYPNGEFGIGYVPVQKKRAEDARQDRGVICDTQFTEQERIHELEDGTKYIDSTEFVQMPSPKFSLPVESSQRRKKYGLKGITGYGRKMIRNGGHCIDQALKYSRRYFAQMGTVTIPSLSAERMRVICLEWSNIVRRFFQECKRRYKKLGMPFHYVSCTEIQPNRWENRREVGLHLHFLFIASKHNNEWSLPDQWVRDTWKRCITTYVGEEEVPENLNYRREAVRESSAAYLAKYASKGTEFVEEVAEEMGEECLPSQWWSMSSSIKNCIKKTTVKSRGDQAELLLHVCRHEIKPYLRYVRVVEIPGENIDSETGEAGDGARIIGYGGMLSAEGMAMFLPTDITKRIKELLPCTLDR